MVPYPRELKESVIKKMMSPNKVSIKQLAEETGIASGTLYCWRKEALTKAVSTPGRGKKLNQWRTEDKFAVVMETAGLNELQLSEYCRKRGLYPELIAEWRETCVRANDQADKHDALLLEQNKQQQKRIKELEKELTRKDKALAEAAALLVLSKKAQAIWGRTEDE